MRQEEAALRQTLLHPPEGDDIVEFVVPSEMSYEQMIALLGPERRDPMRGS